MAKDLKENQVDMLEEQQGESEPGTCLSTGTVAGGEVGADVWLSS